MKTKQVIHLTKNDTIVLTNQTSGQRNEFKVHGVEISEEYPELPVRVYLAIPDPNDKKATAVVGYRWRDNVEVL
jgi:hypothetical protein